MQVRLALLEGKPAGEPGLGVIHQVFDSQEIDPGGAVQAGRSQSPPIRAEGQSDDLRRLAG